MTSMNKKAAMYYASRGWPVLPIWPMRDGKCSCNTDCGKSAGKHPIAKYGNEVIVPRGLEDATTDQAIVAHWFDLIPDANIGCVGKKWFALDVDDEYALEMVLDEYGPLPETVEQYSGSGGRHIFFNQPEPPLGNARGGLPSGIDVRGNVGYCLFAPSVNANGEYQFEVSSKPSKHPIADAPEWLIELIRDGDTIEFSDTEDDVDLSSFEISRITVERIKSAPDEDEDRSRTDQMVINALVESGATDSQIRRIYQTYPIGTEGKYAERGDTYLARTISKARSYVKAPKIRISKAIPGKAISVQEANIEAIILSEVYQKGWNDALVENPEILEAMWPQYLGFDDKGLSATMVNLYDLGFRQDFHIALDDDREFPALVVPITSGDGAVTNLDYTLYGAPDGVQSRRLEQQTAPMFLTDIAHVGRERLLILDDWDVAAYVYLKMSHELPQNIAITALTSEASLASMQASQLAPLLALAEKSEQVIFVTHLHRRSDANILSNRVGREKSRWIGWPLSSREMFKIAGMDAKKLQRAIRSAIPVG